MRKGICRRITGLVLAAALMAAMVPARPVPVQAQGPSWIHMSDVEKDAGMASYDEANDTIAFAVDGGWSSRMRYTGLADTAGKDYAVEFDLNITGGEFGVYSYDDSGALYGVYLDTGAGVLDVLQFTDWMTCVDDFSFRESTTPGATVHPVVPLQNWSAADKAGSRIRVEFLRGQGGTLAGGSVVYYKKDSASGEYLPLGRVDVPDTASDNPDLPNRFGIQLWLGEGTVSNLTVEEYVPKEPDPGPDTPEPEDASWRHMSELEQAEGKAVYDKASDTITFGVDAGWSSRMRYMGLADTTGKDYAVEFDLDIAGGAVGVYNYEDTGAMYGLYLDTGAGVLDALQFTDWMTCVDDFAFRESTSGSTVHPTMPAANWEAASCRGSRIRVEFARGTGGTLAGGTVTYYRKNQDTGEWEKIGGADIPEDMVDHPDIPNHFGIQLWLGEGTVSNLTVEEYTPKPDTPEPDKPEPDKPDPDKPDPPEPLEPERGEWRHMSDLERREGTAFYDEEKGTIAFSSDAGWSSRMWYGGLKDVSGKDYAIEFNLDVDGGAIGIYNYESSGSLYGVYLDTNTAMLDALQFTDWITCVDDFQFRESTTEGAAVHPVVPAPQWDPARDKTGNRIRVEFLRGAGGTLAGGRVNYYKKAVAADRYSLLGTVVIPETLSDDPNLPNYFGIQLWLGSGRISDITVSEYGEVVTEPEEQPEDSLWRHMSDLERREGTASYDEEKGTIAFLSDAGWSSRMWYGGLADVSGKDYAIEFDLSVDGGAIGIYNYESSGALYGVYLDTNTAALDTLQFTDWLTCVDDFQFRESTTEGATIHSVVPASHWDPSRDKTGNRIRVEFLRGAGGTLAGGRVNYYKKTLGTDRYFHLGTVAIPENLWDDPELANYFGIQLWLGAGTISNITLSEYEPVTVGQDPRWMHLNEEEKEVGDAVYHQLSDTITFSGSHGWSSRLINTEIADISGENFAVEFDARLGEAGVIGISPFYEDGVHFYNVYFNYTENLLDGVGIMGADENGKIHVIDDFSYINDKLYPHFLVENQSPTKGQDVKLRIECFLGDGGTMAGGRAYLYFRRQGFSQWKRLGVVKLPKTIQDDPNVPNRLLIHGREANGTISNISVIRGISSPILPVSSAESQKWGYVSDYEKLVGGATYNDSEDEMILRYDGGWSTRMVCLTVDDVTDKAFSLEFYADLAAGGALGIVPFYEDADHWYGVYVDRGGQRLDGAGVIDGEVVDDFDYVDASYFSSVANLKSPLVNQARYRFEYFPNEEGLASGAVCRMYFKQMPGGKPVDEKWHLIGEFTLMDTLKDRSEMPNQIMISARLACGTLSDITYAEMDPNTRTAYDNGAEAFDFEDGYPEDTYVLPAENAEKAPRQRAALPWWSVLLCLAGAGSTMGLSGWGIGQMIRKKKTGGKAS